ncbi:hypothetical protein CYMTET_39050 [Cymbomonas tetramitiformis]|uniref:Uncharacterized protein n=1 Tax=Cymbomonas tetramitiformis TaxID=36881 RepID=A0AAE0CCJ6_9CHLO|nr:hypothetical protein CYMTET_39050 [Cymbomonas tetramitiformis]
MNPRPPLVARKPSNPCLPMWIVITKTHPSEATAASKCAAMMASPIRSNDGDASTVDVAPFVWPTRGRVRATSILIAPTLGTGARDTHISRCWAAGRHEAKGRWLRARVLETSVSGGALSDPNGRTSGGWSFSVLPQGLIVSTDDRLPFRDVGAQLRHSAAKQSLECVTSPHAVLHVVTLRSRAL